MTDAILFILTITLAVCHTGIAFILMQMPGNILNFIKGPIDGLHNEPLKELLQCQKCVSGQVALWIVIAFAIVQPFGVVWYLWIFGGLLWIPSVIVLTDQLSAKYGY